MVSFSVPGRPVPAVRMTQKGKWGNAAQRYLAYKRQVALCAQAAMAGKNPVEGPVVAEMSVFVSGRRGDIDNYIKSVFDACNGIVYRDDRQIGEIRQARVITSAKESVEVKFFW